MIPARKGDPLKKHITAEFINRLNRTTTPKPQLSNPYPQDQSFVLGQIDPVNSTFAYIAQFQPALLDDVFHVQNTANSHLGLDAFKVRGLTNWTTYRPWGIAQEIITQYQAGRVQLTGKSWLDITSLTENTTEHTHIDIRDNKLILQNSGHCRILSYRKPHALVLLGNSPPGTIIGVTTGIIGAGSLASPTSGTIYVYDWNSTGTQLILTGKTITVINRYPEIIASGKVVSASFYGRHFVVDVEPIIPCSEKLEQFTMLSGWQNLKAAAAFMLITASSPDQYGIVEDPLGIFTNQIGYGHSGLSIRTCNGRHFVIQAKCNQSIVTPPVLGMCLIGSAGNSTCANTTEANCTLLGGVWTAATACP